MKKSQQMILSELKPVARQPLKLDSKQQGSYLRVKSYRNWFNN